MARDQRPRRLRVGRRARLDHAALSRPPYRGAPQSAWAFHDAAQPFGEDPDEREGGVVRGPRGLCPQLERNDFASHRVPAGIRTALLDLRSLGMHRRKKSAPALPAKHGTRHLPVSARIRRDAPGAAAWYGFPQPRCSRGDEVQGQICPDGIRPTVPDRGGRGPASTSNDYYADLQFYFRSGDGICRIPARKTPRLWVRGLPVEPRLFSNRSGTRCANYSYSIG